MLSKARITSMTNLIYNLKTQTITMKFLKY